MSSPVVNGIAYDCLDVEGRLDWLDGWHEASGLGFKSTRYPNRAVSWPDPDDINAAAIARRAPSRLSHAASALMAAGRAARERHREATGL